jgi:hypothetical protein
LCGKFPIGHDETLASTNQDVFKGLLDFASRLDDTLRTHFETATVFKTNSKTIQYELLGCILEVWRASIAKETSTANVLSFMTDDTTDVATTTQVIVFRLSVREQCA